MAILVLYSFLLARHTPYGIYANEGCVRRRVGCVQAGLFCKWRVRKKKGWLCASRVSCKCRVRRKKGWLCASRVGCKWRVRRKKGWLCASRVVLQVEGA